MSRPRKHETLTDNIAVLILQHCKRGDGTPLVCRREAREKGWTGKQIIEKWRAQVIRQHGGAHATGGTCEPYNLWFETREVDAVETPKDISRIAKGRRLERRQAEFRAMVLSKAGQAAEPPLPARKKHKRKWPSRTFASQRART